LIPGADIHIPRIVLSTRAEYTMAANHKINVDVTRIQRDDDRIANLKVLDSRATPPLDAGDNQWWSKVSLEHGRPEELAESRTDSTGPGPVAVPGDKTTPGSRKGKERAIEMPTGEVGMDEGQVEGVAVGKRVLGVQRGTHNRAASGVGVVGGPEEDRAGSTKEIGGSRGESGQKGKGKARDEEDSGPKSRKRRRAMSVATTAGGDDDEDGRATNAEKRKGESAQKGKGKARDDEEDSGPKSGKRRRAASVATTAGGDDDDDEEGRPTKKIRGNKDQIVHEVAGATVRLSDHRACSH
jgi:hypothetical protein